MYKTPVYTPLFSHKSLIVIIVLPFFKTNSDCNLNSILLFINQSFSVLAKILEKICSIAGDNDAPL